MHRKMFATSVCLNLFALSLSLSLIHLSCLFASAYSLYYIHINSSSHYLDTTSNENMVNIFLPNKKEREKLYKLTCNNKT